MEKYEIQIIKLPEEKRMDRFGIERDSGKILFNASMKSDHAVEILNHLYQLLEVERRENQSEQSKKLT